MAVVFSLVSTTLPWGPIMAFLVSSPLMSPDTFILLTGFMGLKFAIMLTMASIVLGLVVGYLTWFIEKTGFLENQLQILVKTPKSETSMVSTCGCTQPLLAETKKQKVPVWITTLKISEFATQFFELGIKKIMPLFALFVIIAYLVKMYVPTEWIVTLFSGDHFYSVPLASMIGLPLYVSDATLVPFLQVIREAGASNGAITAFMIAGPGTSLGVIGGLLILLKKRAIFLYVAFIFLGSVATGYLVDFFNII
jgi:uncharacterized membrane protein YraQ (UPF0718 family)